MSTHLRSILAGGALAALLGGCATTGDLRARPAAAQVSSKKTAELFAGCVSEGWQSKSAANVSYAPNPTGVTLITNGPSGVELLLDVRRDGTGSKATLYSRLVFGYAAAEKAVRDCTGQAVN